MAIVKVSFGVNENEFLEEFLALFFCSKSRRKSDKTSLPLRPK
jgi:hypothetical protein